MLICIRVATGYGQPPSTFYDWTLSQSAAIEDGFRLPSDAEGRILIEKFSNKVTKALYSNHADPVGLVNDSERSVLTRFLTRDYETLEQTHQEYESSRMFYDISHQAAPSGDLPLHLYRLLAVPSTLNAVPHYLFLRLTDF